MTTILSRWLQLIQVLILQLQCGGKLSGTIIRSKKAGEDMAKAIIEMVHLMYQNNTANNFYMGMMEELQEEVDKRKPKVLV